jgi:hypothetical protein
MVVHYRSVYQNNIVGWLLIVYSLAGTTCSNYCNIQELSSLHANTQKHSEWIYDILLTFGMSSVIP